MAVRTVRFYRADSRQTLVKAFVQIPYVLFAGDASAGSSGRVTYSVTVRVTDSTGLGLLQDSWTNHLARQMAQPGVHGLEMLEFAVLPGAYQLEVTVEDSLTGRKASTKAEIEGFRSPPPVSDLLLSPQIRMASAGDTVPQTGELAGREHARDGRRGPGAHAGPEQGVLPDRGVQSDRGERHADRLDPGHRGAHDVSRRPHRR